MTTTIYILGVFSYAIGGLLLLCGAIVWVLNVGEKLLDRYLADVRDLERLRIGRDLTTAAWWFSESPDVQAAIQILADTLKSHYAIEPDKWREEWRRRPR